MTDQSEPQPGPSRENQAPSAMSRPVGMVPMFNLMTSKFKGRDSDIGLGEWKSNLKTTFVLQGVPNDFRAELTLCCLEGKAKREILILPPEKRNTAELIFGELDKLYGDRATASVLRSQFFNARQEPHEDISSFALRLQEDFLRLKKKDSRGIRDDDVLLRDHLIEGLRDSAMRGEFRAKILLDDSLTFQTIKAELSLREQAYGETFEQAHCLAMRGHNQVNFPHVKDLEQIKTQLRDEMNTQMSNKFNELSQSLIQEIRSELHQRTPREAEWSQPAPRSGPPRRNRPRLGSANRYDGQGNPICNLCSQPGHIARSCTNRQRSASLN